MKEQLLDHYATQFGNRVRASDELLYAIDEALTHYKPLNLEHALQIVEYVFACEWDSDITFWFNEVVPA